MEQYNPINNDKNNQFADQYRSLSQKKNVYFFCGRLAEKVL